MKEFVPLRPEIYSYLTDDGHVDEGAKGTKKCVAKQKINFEDCQTCMENNRSILRIQQKFPSEAQNLLTEKINKIALSVDDDKRI